ncbi:hypothetical protein HUA78_13410 [Myxococcus sp. CA033]|uniref:hypothetical protein n=1 Tax=Myxococcus sp. CA033 TaxID=2741516 RepID=UPI00157A4FE9|nr:hypothetical protein [Myxococcus sp. CA033]NTX35441.1 hypothetical protein [Myxococcus sp. CA033]
MAPVIPASVAWYVTGRFYLASKDSMLQDLGYFIHLEGLHGPLFEDPSGKVAESTALLTFRSTPFKSVTLDNGGLSLSVDPVGDFTVYLNEQRPGRPHFDDPESFSAGRPIATFRRASVVVGGAFDGPASSGRSLSLNVFTARIVWSTAFELNGARYDLKDLLPHGITQWGECGPSALANPPQGFSKVVPFVGSAVAVAPGLSR